MVNRSVRLHQIRQIFYFLVFLIVPIFLIVLFKTLFTVWIPSVLPSDSEWFQSRLIYFLILQYLFLLIGFFSLHLARPRETRFFILDNWFSTLGKALVPAVVTFLAAYLAAMGVFLLSIYLPIPAALKDWISTPNEGFIRIFNEIRDQNVLKIFLWFLVITVMAPFAEEILYRGFLQEFLQYFKTIRRIKLDLVIVNVLFAVFHIHSLSNAVYALVVGFFLSYYRRKSGNINITIWIHGLINLTGLLSGIVFRNRF